MSINIPYVLTQLNASVQTIMLTDQKGHRAEVRKKSDKSLLAKATALDEKEAIELAVEQARADAGILGGPQSDSDKLAAQLAAHEDRLDALEAKLGPAKGAKKAAATDN